MAIMCKKCGAEISYVRVLCFNHEGADQWNCCPLQEHENSAVSFETDRNWTSYGQGEEYEEIQKGIRCPHCDLFPFGKEIQVYEPVRVVMFQGEEVLPCESLSDLLDGQCSGLIEEE